MALDPISSDPSDWNKALENYKKTGELSLPIKERWRSISKLSNETDLTNQEIADRVGLKTGQQVANEKVKIRRWEKETGTRLLYDSPIVNRATREVELLNEAKKEWHHDKAELVNLLHLIHEGTQRGLPFRGIPTRGGLTKSKFDELWKELNDAGFQEDGTLWQGMTMPKTKRDMECDEVVAYAAYLANHPDRLPEDFNINPKSVTDTLINCLVAIAIVRAKNGKLDTLLSFKPYVIPREYRNKENTEKALRILREL